MFNFWGTATLLSTVAVAFYTLTSNVWKSQYLYILKNMNAIFFIVAILLVVKR
jgi:hypothetical protein